MNIFDQVIEIERSGKLWKLSAFRRYDPLTIGFMAAGTALQTTSTLKEGKEAEQIANARADVDDQNAIAVREASVEKAKIQGERGRRALAEQKGAAAASGIRIDVGSPLVIEAETKANIAKDIGFGLEAGRVESASLRNSAAFERALGKTKRKQSKFKALSQGLLGAGSIALAGSRLPGKTPAVPGSPVIAKSPLKPFAPSGDANFLPFGRVRA